MASCKLDDIDVPDIDFRCNPDDLNDGADAWFSQQRRGFSDSFLSPASRLLSSSSKPKFNGTITDNYLLSNDANNLTGLCLSPRVVLRDVLSQDSSSSLNVTNSSISTKKTILERIMTKKSTFPTIRLLQRRHSIRPHLSHSLRGTHNVSLLNSSKIMKKKIKENANKSFDFIASLRRYSPSANNQKKPSVHSTVPEPFKLSQSRVKKPVNVERYQSVAEQVVAFERGTSARFHTEPKQPSQQQRRRSKPHSPKLLTFLRSRPNTAVSQLEKENQEIEDMKKFKFQAQPIKKSALYEKPVLPKVEVKGNTTFEPFSFALPERYLGERLEPFVKLEPLFEFHARAVPKGLFDQPKLKDASSIPVTEPKTPTFQQRKRAKKTEPAPVAVNTKPVEVKVKHPSSTSEPFHPVLQHRVLEPEPFSFEERDKQSKALKEQKIKAILDEEKRLREFRAQSQPTFAAPKLPEKKVIQKTEQLPFQLLSDERGTKKKMEFQNKVEQEQAELKKMTEFRAKPCPDLTQIFVPEKTSKSYSGFVEFGMHSDKRAKEREQFDEMLRAHEAEQERIREEERMKRERMERAAVAQLRRDAVHRAAPVRHYQPVIIAPGAPPTSPMSPNLRTLKRKRDSNNVTQ